MTKMLISWESILEKMTEDTSPENLWINNVDINLAIRVINGSVLQYEKRKAPVVKESRLY